MKHIILALALSITTLATRAHAAGDFDVVGAACVPAPSAMNRYMTTGGGGVSHAFQVSAPIDFWCAIPHAPDMQAPTMLKLMYTDLTSTAGNQVIITYYKQHKTTGVLTSIASVFSDSCALASPSTCTTTFTDTFDPATYRYTISVTIQRTGAFDQEVFWGATLQ